MALFFPYPFLSGQRREMLDMKWALSSAPVLSVARIKSSMKPSYFKEIMKILPLFPLHCLPQMCVTEGALSRRCLTL